LKQFYTPSDNGCIEIFLLSQLSSFKDLNSVNDRHSSVEFSTWNVIIQIGAIPFDCLGWHPVLGNVVDQLIPDYLKDSLELGASSSFCSL